MTAPQRRPALFEVAANPDPDSSLPFLIRLPLPRRRARAQGARQLAANRQGLLPPRQGMPEQPKILERVAVRSCRRGVAIDLVLDRPRENRSQLVFTRIQGGREGIFWQTARSTRQARPGIRVPRRRAARLAELRVLVDTRERYPYRFATRRPPPSVGPCPSATTVTPSTNRSSPSLNAKASPTSPAGWSSGSSPWQTCRRSRERTYRFLGAALAYVQAETDAE